MVKDGIQEIVNSVEDNQRDNFLEFITTGHFSSDFIDYLLSNEIAQSSVRLVYEIQGANYNKYMKRFL